MKEKKLFAVVRNFRTWRRGLTWSKDFFFRENEKQIEKCKLLKKV